MTRNLLELIRIIRNRKLPAAKLRRLRERKLRAVIRNAYEHVPYYRSLFRAAGLTPEDIRTLKDLEHVPVTTKDDLKAAGVESITAQWADVSACAEKRTGGSSGKYFVVYRTEHEQGTAELIMTASQFAAGCRPWDRIAILGADIRLPEHFYHRLGVYRRAIIPVRLPIESQIRRLGAFQPTVLMCWPSSIRAVMHHISGPLRDLVNPKVIISVSEVLDDHLRARLEEEVDADLFNMYAAHECAQIAMECHTHEGLHLQADHLIMESLEDGKAVGCGRQGVAVLTSLYSFAMPFIRYNLGDLVVLRERKCSCGSAFPLMDHPMGRVNEMLRLPSGTSLSPQGFVHCLRDFPAIDQWRVIQETPSRFILKIVMRHEPGKEIVRSLRAQVLEYLGENVTVDIQLVSHIEEERLKFRHFISKISP